MLNQEGWNLCFFIKVDISEIYISFVFFSAKQKKNKQYMYFQYVNLFECNILSVYEG